MTQLTYKFKNEELLKIALRHYYYSNKPNHETEELKRINTYQRLEFIGDKVLGLALGEQIMELNPSMDEGDLSVMLAKLVNKNTIAKVAIKINLDKMIILDESKLPPRQPTFSIKSLEDTMEAVIGAIFLDGGYETAKMAILEIWSEEITAADQSPQKDPKTQLQELVQKTYNGSLPEYSVMSVMGQAHSPTFTVKVITAGGKSAIGIATNKKEAESMAAANLLESLNEYNSQQDGI